MKKAVARFALLLLSFFCFPALAVPLYPQRTAGESVSRKTEAAQSGKEAEAVETGGKIFALPPDFTIDYYAPGQFRLHKNSLNNLSIEDLHGAMRKNPDNRTFYLKRGIEYAEDGNFAEAAADFTYLIDYERPEAAAYMNRAALYCQRHKAHGSEDSRLIKWAIADLLKAAELAPNFADAYVKRGILYRVIEEYELSVADFTRALELVSNSSELLEERAKTFEAAGKKAEAEADRNKAQELKGDSPKDK